MNDDDGWNAGGPLTTGEWIIIGIVFAIIGIALYFM
jgi:hypothetical protein